MSPQVNRALPYCLSLFTLRVQYSPGQPISSYLTELDEGCVHDGHEVLEADVAAESRGHVHELDDGDLGAPDLLHVAHLCDGSFKFFHRYGENPIL